MRKNYNIIILLLTYSLLSYSQYIEQNSGVTVNLTGGSVVQNNWGQIAWICGNNGTVIRTVNSGNNWINKSGNGIPSNVNLVNIFAVSDSICFTAGNIGTMTYIYRTSNTGNSWITVFTQANGKINAINMKTRLLGFMQGNPIGGRWSLWKTTNGGINWDSTGMYLPQAGAETGFNNSMACSKTRIWFGTNNSRVYYSTNYGNNWTVQSTSPEQNIKAVWFYWLDSTFLMAGGSTLLKSTNSGFNWIASASIGTGDFGGFTYGSPGVSLSSPPVIQYYVRSDNKLYQSVFNQNWNIVHTAPAGNYNFLTDPFSYVGYSYAIRSNGGITFIITQWGSVKKIGNKIPEEYSLSQNYPNPFNPSTTIEFDVSKSEVVYISLYDITGRLVEVLANELMSPGRYRVSWNGSNYASGVYFYKINAENYSETKKMVLMK